MGVWDWDQERRSERGATALTYGLVVGLVAVAGIAAVTRVGDSTNILFTDIAEEMTGTLDTGGDDPAVETPTPPTLYNFSNHTFTPCGATGRSGPSLSDCQNSYSPSEGAWDEDAGVFAVSGGIQEWSVPQSGRYRIEARGAQGGAGNNGFSGGTGARVRAEFTLSAGDRLDLLVGQQGLSIGNADGGGGGGSFVVLNGTSLLLAAGGGGGGGYGQAGANASLTETPTTAPGVSGIPVATGSTGGRVCGTYSDCQNGSGGGGYSGDGARTSITSGYPSDNYVLGGQSFSSGGLGGTSPSGSSCTSQNVSPGGFGGGGGSPYNSAGGGGGGGYAGGHGGPGDSGDCGTTGSGSGGGGGSSYIDSRASSHAQPGQNSGDGAIEITFLGP